MGGSHLNGDMWLNRIVEPQSLSLSLLPGSRCGRSLTSTPSHCYLPSIRSQTNRLPDLGFEPPNCDLNKPLKKKNEAHCLRYSCCINSMLTQFYIEILDISSCIFCFPTLLFLLRNVFILCVRVCCGSNLGPFAL